MSDETPVPTAVDSEGASLDVAGDASAERSSGSGGSDDDALANAAAGIDDDPSVVFDDLGDMSFADAVDATIVEFDEGDIVSGIVVQIDKDEVLLDIGFKSEGVIPSKELS